MKYTRIITHSFYKILLVFYSVLGKGFIQSYKYYNPLNALYTTPNANTNELIVKQKWQSLTFKTQPLLNKDYFFLD